MVKSVLGVNHQGVRDWLIQRISALLLAVYSIFLVVFIVLHPNLSFAEWHALFAHSSMKLATLLILVALLGHAWVGMWTILTDYVKPFVIRFILNIFILLLLIVFFFAGLLTLWGF